MSYDRRCKQSDSGQACKPALKIFAVKLLHANNVTIELNANLEREQITDMDGLPSCFTNASTNLDVRIPIDDRNDLRSIGTRRNQEQQQEHLTRQQIIHDPNASVVGACVPAGPVVDISGSDSI